LKAGFFVVLLLRCHAIEPDHARAGMRDRRIPYPHAVAFAAQIGAHDVEAEEGKARIVIDAGDGRGRRAIEFWRLKSLPDRRKQNSRHRQGRGSSLQPPPIPQASADFSRPHRSNALRASICVAVLFQNVWTSAVTMMKTTCPP
jgi:hypothetical protein